MDKPSIVIVSSSSIKPKSLIKLITGAPNVFEDQDSAGKIWHPWKIDTKYYTANIDVYGITEDCVRSQEFNESVQALLVHMDSNKDTGLVDLEKWADIEAEFDPEIKLLLSNYCTDTTKITKAQATAWCLKRGFELIELYPAIEKPNDAEETEIIEEKTGVNRIVEALQTHIWPNLIMKEKRKTEINPQVEQNEGDSSVDTNLEVDSSLLNNFLTDEGADDFAELFSQLNMIKESMKSMPSSQRKQCAEQMVTAFWQAIGGDEEEILDA